jgi:uncharacterized protein (DUF736 family)
MNEQKSIGALWLKESKSGTKFFSGNIEIDGKKIAIVIFRNTKKPEGSKQPDYRILESVPMEKPPLENMHKDDFGDDIPF